MGFFDFVKKAASNVGNAFSGARKLGDSVMGGVKAIGEKANKVVRVGQNVLNEAEKVGKHIGNIPVVGDIAREVYENTPLKHLHQTARQQLDSAERITGNVAKGDMKGALQEALRNPLVKNKVGAIEGAIGAALPNPLQPYFETGRKAFHKEFM